MLGLAIFFGCFVGFALGLTGGGGGIIAVPMLVYGLSMPQQEAAGISLAAVGGTALFGVIPRLRRGEVELRTGIPFALAGMLGSPAGIYCAQLIPESVLLLMSGLLMTVVGWRMWQKSRQSSSSQPNETAETDHRKTCQRDADGKLLLTSKCAMLLLTIGLLTGFLSGMFGIGGGFVIVPALVFFSGMKIHRAVATSLLAIVLVSISGVTSYVAEGYDLNWQMASLFLVGGIIGMWTGTRLARRLQGPTLQKVFSTGVVLVAIFMISEFLFTK